MKILVIEDDEIVSDILVHVLTGQNYAVEIATDGQTGWNLIESFDYDLVLLDILLPKLDGISLCRKIRSAGIQTPILLLTGCNNGHEKAIGLDAGADDYVVKPFDQEELVARIRALLRRSNTGAQPILEWGNLQLDPSSCEVTYSGTLLALTPKEYALLELFLRNHRRVFSCGMILEHLWSYEEVPGEEAVRTHIKGLRQKLKAAGCPPDLIETVYGIGYRLNPKSADRSDRDRSISTPQRQNKQTHKTLVAVAANGNGHSQSSQQQTLTLVNQVWHKFKAQISDQVGVLEQAIMALNQGELKPSLKNQARREAHTLAGSLGTFGLATGSHLSRQIETKFQTDRSLSLDELKHLQQWITALKQEIQQASQQSAPHGTTDLETNRPLILIVDTDYAAAEQLMIAASKEGLRLEIAANLTRAQERIYLEQPSLVLLDPAITTVGEPDRPHARSSQTDCQQLLTELKKHVPPIPVIIYTAQATLSDRREFLQLSDHTFLQKPAAPAQVLDIVTQVLQQVERSKETILAVDDDPGVLAVLRTLLEPWGFKVMTLDDPQLFWQTLEATAPDLLILDIEMPHVNGIELCQIVRSDSSWSDLPILVLTAHTDADMVNQVFTAGADDFVSKPIIGPELIMRTINRLERMKLLKRRYTTSTKL